MNRPIRVMAIGCLVLFLALMININYLQYIGAQDLNERAGNRRVLVDEYSRKRGPIVVDGEPVAQSRPVDDEYEYLRRYPEPDLYANLTGYYSFLYGSSALENSQNGILSGNDNRLFVNRVVDLVGSNEPEGGSVELTIDPAAQQAAYDGLLALGDDVQGAVVALDPSTGAVLAMVSTPSYNPNRLSSHDFGDVQDYYDALTSDPDKPNLDRTRRDVYPPGSTFKLVTAAAALSDEELDLDAQSTVEAGPSLSFADGGSYELVNQSDAVCGAEQLTMSQALAASCNVVFGRLALQVGAEDLAAQAQRFGFGDDSYLEALTVVPSRFSTEDPATLNGPETAQSGIGQFDVAATPLQMAMVVAGIANEGTVMKPYVVSRTRSPEASILDNTEPEALTEGAVSPEVAQELTDMMVAVVEDGTASSIAIPDVSVGGKTGTAERGEDDQPYAWMVSMAPAEDPQVAVAVLVQDARSVTEVSGGGVAGPIAKAVMQAVIGP